MPTIRDVARAAGVAPITVSRVINRSGYIREETRERVEAAIAKLGYVPNTLARSLRSKQTGTLALILSDITNPFWTTVARGVEDVASEAGYNVIFCNTDESEAEQDRYLRVLLEKQVDGVLLVPARSAGEPVRFVQERSVPIVILDRTIPEVKADVVRCDSEGGAYELVRVLIALGHRRIAALSGPEGVSTSQDRVAGYERALTEAGIACAGNARDARLVSFGAFTQESGYERTRAALAAAPRPTAIFAANNFLAIGALKALADAELAVPDSMALVAFDDLPAGLVVEPFLTVATQPAYEMGGRATKLLLDRLLGQGPDGYQDIVLPTDIILRKSSGRARLAASDIV